MLKTTRTRIAVTLATAATLAIGVPILSGCACSSQQSTSETVQKKDSKEEKKQEVETPTSFTVPNVVSLSQSDAEKAIHASGLQVGTVKVQASDTVPSGSVISQDPVGLTNAKPNSKINLVVSSGKAAPKEVTVPDLKGKSQADAEKALSAVGLVGVASNPEETSEVQPGLVFKQSVAAGTKTKEGARVAFTVAVAPSQATVPNVVGMSHDDARNAIVAAKLGYDSTTSYSDSVAEGKVIAQSVAAGTKVKQGSTLTVNVSLGKKPVENVTVPDVMTYTWDDAQNAMRSAGLAVRYTGDVDGLVVAQDVAAGTKVAPNTLVTVTLESSQPDPSVQFLGTWQADRASLTVDNIGSGFYVTIDWSASADEHYRWEYVTDPQGNRLWCDGAGRKYHTTADGETETEYENGTAEFTLDENGRIVWNDMTEAAGAGLLFSKIG